MVRFHRLPVLAGAVLLLAAALPLVASGVSPAGAGPGDSLLVISEVRSEGADGVLDDYVELLNRADAPHLVQTSDGSVGYALALSNGSVACTVPNGTVIPAHGHWLCMGLSPSSVDQYPAGSGETVGTGDATASVDLPDDVGIALFRTSTPAAFVLANRLDAVGPVAETDPLYREGAGLPLRTTTSFNTAWVRTPDVALLETAVDTDDNAADFQFVDGAATTDDAARRLGAPGPERLSSPRSHAGVDFQLIDRCLSRHEEPNLVRDTAAGTVEVRRRLTNLTGGDVTRLRLRIVAIANLPGGVNADLRATTSDFDAVPVDDLPCGDGVHAVSAHGTLLETPPAQALGGGLNSTLSVSDVSPGQPLADGDSIDLRILLDVEVAGRGGMIVVPEVVTDGPTTGVLPHPGACLATTTTDEGAPDLCAHNTVTASEVYTTAEDTALVVAAPGVLSNDVDADQDVPTADLVAAPEHGQLVLAPDGGFTFTPEPGFTGSDSFVYSTGGTAEVVGLVVEPAAATTTTEPPPTTTTTSPAPTTTTPPTTEVAPTDGTPTEPQADVDAASGTAPGTLPRTGTDPAPLVAAAITLLATGAALNRQNRRRAA